MKIQWTASGLRADAKAPDIAGLRARFRRFHFIRFRELISPALARTVRQGLAEAHFKTFCHRDSRRGTRIALEFCMRRNAVYSLLQFLSNDPDWLKLIQRITGCGRIGCFNGRVYRMAPGKGHYDSWHSDIDAKTERMVGMSVNLSERPYQGGVLQFRRADAPRILREIENLRLGDAILFRLAPFLRHRLTPVNGTRAKTAYAGWYQARPLHYLSADGTPKPARTIGSLRLLDRSPERDRSRLTPQSTVRTNAVFRPNGKRFDLLDPRNGRYYALDGTGAEIWRSLQEPRRLKQVVERIQKRYDAPAGRLCRDVLTFAEILKSRRLIHTGPR